MAKTNKKLLELELDQLHSVIIRKRDADEFGMVKCATCPSRMQWIQITCGHFRKRRHMGTRWHLKNGGPQCSFCNGQDKDMQPYIESKFGKETVTELIQLSHQDQHFSIDQLKEKIEEFHAML
jgi:hypothetical protein